MIYEARSCNTNKNANYSSWPKCPSIYWNYTNEGDARVEEMKKRASSNLTELSPRWLYKASRDGGMSSISMGYLIEPTANGNANVAYQRPLPHTYIEGTAPRLD